MFSLRACQPSHEYMQKWAALDRWKDRAVYLFLKLAAAHHHTGARPAQRLVRRRGNEIHVREGAGMKTCGDQSGYVSDVGHRVSANVAGNATYPLEVNDARVRR